MRFWLLLALFLLPTHVWAQDNPDYFANAEISNPNPFIGQQIVYVFRLYDAVGLEGVAYEPPEFEGFWRVDFNEVSQTVQQINGRQYTITEIRTALYPTRTGSISIPSGKVILPETVFRAGDQLLASDLEVNAQPLPEPKPDGFSGAVGQFQMSATLDRQQIQLGEPVVLHLAVSGSGNVEQLPIPTLSLPQSWQQYENPSTYTISQQDNFIIGTKNYEVLIFPEQTGEQILPTVTLVYFDPAIVTYLSVDTVPIVLDVVPPADDGSGASADLNQPVTAHVLPLKPISSVFVGGGGFSSAGFWFLWLLPPALLLAVWGGQRWKLHQDKLRVVAQQSLALKTALGQLQNVVHLKRDKAYPAMANLIVQYAAHRLGDEQALKVNINDLMDELKGRNVSDAVFEPIYSCIVITQEGLYAPENTDNLKLVAKQIAAWLTNADALWKSS